MHTLLTVDEVAQVLKISKNTLYSNPKRYRMFKLGGLLRAKPQDIEEYIEECRKKSNTVIRLALATGNKESKKCQYSRERGSTISISEHPAAKELRSLLG